MTSLTTIWADQNSPQIDRSAEVSGSAGARSVGFIECPFRLKPNVPAPLPQRSPDRTTCARLGARAPNIPEPVEIRAARHRPSTDSARNLSKLGLLPGISRV